MRTSSTASPVFAEVGRFLSGFVNALVYVGNICADLYAEFKQIHSLCTLFPALYPMMYTSRAKDTAAYAAVPGFMLSGHGVGR